jgi:OOP family OmpA-OmpF porin
MGLFMIKQITAAVLLAATSFAASAAEPTQFYVGADVASTKIDDLSRETGFGVFAGYKFNETFAIEGTYRKLGDFDTFSEKAKGTHLAVSVLASLPVADQLAVYGRLGYGRAEFKGDAGKEHLNRALFGIGLDYAITKEVSARVEWQRPASDAQILSVGVAYNF